MDYDKELERYKNQFLIINEKYDIANKWIYLQNHKKSLVKNLIGRGIQQIIIYGASDFAVRLIEYCENEEYKIKAIADKKIIYNGAEYKGIPLISMDEIGKMDLSNTSIVITAMGYYEEIKKSFEQKNIKNVMSLRELIESALQ